ncbi:hypothetical protein BB560_006909 [Smittium megazygosporum]|uniref:PRELI/MSF1 domain-containing protein n=1 Tax=Smittium megazygosporum TaxID=133381 RepID=A0A2T9Y0E5_9FUNG|nr:hypothetical protein BB560_006909 [Smittium megazygosporum]
MRKVCLLFSRPKYILRLGLPIWVTQTDGTIKRIAKRENQFKGLSYGLIVPARLFSFPPKSSSILGSSWETVSYAYLNRYPNPYATHVLAADTIEHKFDPETGILSILRLYQKTNSPPGNSKAYILEEITIDPERQTLETNQRNISHTRLLLVLDSLKISPTAPSLEKNFESSTDCVIEGRLISTFGYGLASRIEGFSLKRMKDNFVKSHNGLSYTINLLKEKKFSRESTKNLHSIP